MSRSNVQTTRGWTSRYSCRSFRGSANTTISTTAKVKDMNRWMPHGKSLSSNSDHVEPALIAGVIGQTPIMRSIRARTHVPAQASSNVLKHVVQSTTVLVGRKHPGASLATGTRCRRNACRKTSFNGTKVHSLILHIINKAEISHDEHGCFRSDPATRSVPARMRHKLNGQEVRGTISKVLEECIRGR